MSKCGVSDIQDAIKDGLFDLECSNLKFVNEPKYLEFKTMYEELDNKITNNKDKSSSFIDDLKKIQDKINDYMTSPEGREMLDNFQTSSIKHVIESLSNRLNKNNVEETEKELEETLTFTKSITTSEMNSAMLSNTINKTKYQIYKYKLNDFVWDDTISTKDFMMFILEDIYNIVKNNNSNSSIKERLEKYLITPSFIKKDINKPIILINLNKRKKIGEARIKKELNRILYKASDLKKDSNLYTDKTKEYINNLINNKKEVQANIAQIYKDHNNKNLKDYLALYLVNNTCDKDKVFEIVKEIDKKKFDDYIALFKTIIFNHNLSCIKYLLVLKDAFSNINKNLDYELDCAIIAYINTIKLAEVTGILTENGVNLKKYIIATNNDYLLKHLLKHNLVDKELIKHEVLIKNETFLEELAKTRNIDLLKEYLSCLINQKESIKNVIDEYLDLSKLSFNDKKEFLINYAYLLIDTDDFSYLLGRLEAYGDYNLIVKFMEHLADMDNKDKIIKVYNTLSNKEIKNKITEYIYDEINHLDNLSVNASLKEANPFYQFTKIPTLEDLINKKANYFEAYTCSKKLNSGNCEVIEALVINYGSYHMDWDNIVLCTKKVWQNAFKSKIYKKIYEVNKEEFWLLNAKYNLMNEAMAKSIVNDNPEEINNLIVYLNSNEILKLPSKTLDIFCRNFEVNLKLEKKTLNDLITSIGSLDTKIKLFTYIAYRGLISNEILIYYENTYHEFFFQSIINSKDKYKRPGFYKKLLDKNKKLFKLNKNIDYNFLFLTSLEIKEIEDDAEGEELGIVKIRKYYWDLVELIDKVNDKTKKRIIAYISKSGHQDLINYVKTNYASYAEDLIASIDEDLSEIV